MIITVILRGLSVTFLAEIQKHCGGRLSRLPAQILDDVVGVGLNEVLGFSGVGWQSLVSSLENHTDFSPPYITFLPI
jgi:hypothetical protein